MREHGVVIPKRQLADQIERFGDLCVMETSEQTFKRLIRLAKVTYGKPPNIRELVLYDPQLLWINEQRMVLSGFKRIVRDGQTVDFAQSWLVMMGMQD